MRLIGKNAIVTGGSSGIGAATVIKLCSEGANVILADINEGKAQKIIAQTDGLKGEAKFFPLDVSRKEEVESCIEYCLNNFDSLDIIFNNAGIGGPLTFFEDQSDEDWDRIIAVNQTGVFYCMRAALKVMKTQRSGIVINTASLAGIGSAPRMGAYAASKHAVVGMTKTAASEYGKYGIRVNAICPTVIETPMGNAYMNDDTNLSEIIKSTIPMKRFGQASEVADIVCWLCSDESTYVTGETIRVDGGHRA